jgi:hypothetical protein
MAASSAPPTLKLKVIWPGGNHDIEVTVLIVPPLAHMTRAGEELAAAATEDVALPARRHDFDQDVLFDDDSFYAALRAWTVTAKPDSPVLAQVVETRLPKLLERAKVEPPVPAQPIEVRLP